MRKEISASKWKSVVMRFRNARQYLKWKTSNDLKDEDYRAAGPYPERGKSTEQAHTLKEERHLPEALPWRG
jgi:hypothetical protein